ncbi:MAG: M1 family aminopeptidase [Halomonas sp.]|uniref:M1 family metallopeptidase n=1 Tax=Halomonas sp. TaxID=1486246 RepID=UPI002ACE3864|nr:M1 family aminopeptidase [Halomonas sp.]MDZ7853242.1 M1 family aminopeptidase [Halomonas sp.]
MNRPAQRRSSWLLALLWLSVAGLAWRVAEADPATRTLIIRLDPATRDLQGELRQVLPTGGSFRLLEGLSVTSARRGDEVIAVARDAEGHWRISPGGNSGDGEVPVILRWRGTLPEAGERDRHRVAVGGTLLPNHAGWYPHLGDAAGPLWLTVKVPEGQRAVGSGSLLEERWVEGDYQARFHHPRTREVEIAAGPWKLREREVEGVRLRTLFPDDLDTAFAETYLERTAAHLSLFQARLGRLPYSSFAVAASPAPVGLAFAGFTLLGERVIPLPFIPHTSLPHELMHAWWGAGVKVDYSRGNWSEALTTYLADHALAEQRGEAETMRRRWLVDLAALPPGQESALVAFRGTPDPAGRLIGYQHGALLFHMLRQRIGDEAFDRGLRHLADTWMHRTADWSALIDAFSEAAGEPQGPFLDPWLTRPGRPSLHLEAVRVEAGERGDRLVGELVQRGRHAPWPLVVPLVVQTEDGPVRLTRRMEGERQSFEVPLASPPLALEVDPEADLLRHPGATPSILRQLTLDPTTRILALDDAYHPLAKRVLGHEANTFSASDDLKAEEIEPLLVIGTTTAVQEWRQANDLPAPSQLQETAGQARFWMVPGRPIGLLSGDDANALARLATSLRHHGQRSYVVQGPDGRTTQAGTWTVEENPLRITFTR